MSELGVGSVIGGRYALEELASDEFLGPVYFARDQERDRRVRLKVLRPELVGDDQRFRRFQREIEAFGRVRSAGVLTLMDTGSQGAIGWAAFAPVPEQTVASRVAAGAMAWKQAVDLLAGVVVGVGALHREGVVHRNLTGRNVLLGDGGKPWIRDLGLAHLVSTVDTTDSLTDADDRVGNLSTMAPEYLSQREMGPSADLYAIGVLAYELLTGGPPFEGRGPQLVRQTLSDPPPPMSTKGVRVPAALEALVQELLDKDPGSRPAPDRILARLKGIVGDERAAPRRRPWGLIAGGVVTVTVAVGVGYLATLPPPPPPPPQGIDPIASELPAPGEVTERWLLPPEPRQVAKVVGTAREASRADRRVVEADATALVRSNQRAMVTLDGVPAGFTPIRLHAVPGKHDLTLVLPGRSETTQRRTVVFSESTEAQLTLVF